MIFEKINVQTNSTRSKLYSIKIWKKFEEN